MHLLEILFTVCDIIIFEINLSFFIKSFSNMTKTAGQKFKYLKNKKGFKKHFSPFERAFIETNNATFLEV